MIAVNVAKKRKTLTGATRDSTVSESSYSFLIPFYVLLFVLCYVTYRAVLDNYLYNDDFLWIAAGRYEMELDNLLTYRVIGFFRPLVNASFYLMERIAPGNLPVYYFENIFIHFLNSILVFHLVLSILHKRAVAATTAVFFVVASTHAGAVFWISARTTLISTMLLLSSLVVLVRSKGTQKHLVVSLVLFVLALSAKETAVVGALLVGLLFLFFRNRKDTSVGSRALLSFSAVTIVYLIVRFVAIGAFVQSNWGPGVHVLRNIAGGGVYQLAPWTVESLLGLSQIHLGVGEPVITRMITHSTHAIWPEILIVPQLTVMFLIAKLAKKHREMSFAVLWMFVCLIPVAFLKTRFLTTSSFTHDRYYYLASIGACLAIVIMLSPLWDSRRIKKYGTVLAALILFVVFSSEMLRVRLMEDMWHVTTEINRQTVMEAIRRLDSFENVATFAVQDSSVSYRYLSNAVRLERPAWNLVRVTRGRTEAMKYRPCVYLEFEQQGDRVFMKTIILDKSTASPQNR